MKRIISTLLAAALCAGATLVAGASPAGAAPVAARTDPPALRVMPLGDSITVGVGSTDSNGYRLPLWNLITQQSDFTASFVGSQRDGNFEQPWHEGHSGWMIDDLRANADDWLADSEPDVILLHIGINDLDRGDDKPHAADRLAALIDQIFDDRPGATVAVMGLIPTTGGLQDLVKQFNQQAQDLVPGELQLGRHLNYVDPPALTAAEFYDRLHPDDLGYARMANSFFGALDNDVKAGWLSTDSPKATAKAH
ncbi:SGNH/GDSL hydrolase family protein [Kitasatospora sp. GAS204B]|uniref:SGNH/GDSL hydrolase family protein n=1 Tax=unclassified Kitasatospora TaxID=2633591 RepID=UPI002474EF94|nr:SGNH/GDSL hydrolase family protein [Kitasatospora sp. GAS204B]MDH6120578.1 lysophospholipase L1-like esterase [Kitasatospora sp. GAS204B]